MFQYNNRYAEDVSFTNIMSEVKDVSQKIVPKRNQFG